LQQGGLGCRKPTSFLQTNRIKSYLAKTTFNNFTPPSPKKKGLFGAVNFLRYFPELLVLGQTIFFRKTLKLVEFLSSVIDYVRPLQTIL
jgi:hypothetical protein